MESSEKNTRFVICIKNDGYPASLELCKVYLLIPDAQGAKVWYGPVEG